MSAPPPARPPRVAFAVPGDPGAATGGYGYDRRVAHELREAGVDLRWLRLPDGFPDPSPSALDAAYGLLDAADPDETLLVDGLALGAMPEVARAIGARAIVALVHHPLAMETGLTAARAQALRDAERRALAAARRVVVTSASTAAALVADYGVPAARIVVAPPGTDPAPPAAGSGGPGLVLLAVGALVPRKGHDVLVDALARLRSPGWRLVAVGDDARDPAWAASLRARVRAAGLQDRIAFAGVLDDAALAAAYAGADAFVVASRHEGFGMAAAEAIARGLPVVTTDAGGLRESVPEGAGLRVPPDDVEALAAALRTLVDDPRARETLADGARRAADAQTRWRETAALVERALREAA